MLPLWNQIKAAGDGALSLEFGQGLDPWINRSVHAVARAIRRAHIDGVRGVVPAYTTLLVEFNPLVISGEDLANGLKTMEVVMEEVTARCFTIPTLYGGEYGLDLEEIAKRLAVSPESVIAAHTATRYQIYCVGFSPGFPLCGILPEGLRLPRRSTPRTVVPAGSVAIAGAQTGVYPTASPGGWNILGRTPASLFHVHRDPPIRYEPGDYLQFRAIGSSEYEELLHAAGEGYDVVIEGVPNVTD